MHWGMDVVPFSAQAFILVFVMAAVLIILCFETVSPLGKQAGAYLLSKDCCGLICADTPIGGKCTT